MSCAFAWTSHARSRVSTPCRIGTSKRAASSRPRTRTPEAGLSRRRTPGSKAQPVALPVVTHRVPNGHACLMAHHGAGAVSARNRLGSPNVSSRSDGPRSHARMSVFARSAAKQLLSNALPCLPPPARPHRSAVALLAALAARCLLLRAVAAAAPCHCSCDCGSSLGPIRRACRPCSTSRAHWRSPRHATCSSPSCVAPRTACRP